MSTDDVQASQTSPSAAETDLSRPSNGGLRSLVRERRRKLGWDDHAVDNPDLWGLALSGGGIRSATFCFGLLKALAHNKAFQRFDVLSTVSGGGYIGATVGKLFQNAAESQQSARDVEEALADADSRWFGFWLRANGRYLIPNGAKDTIFAVANFSRNLIGVHVEMALLGMLLGAVLVLFNVSLWQWADCFYSNGCMQPSWISMRALDRVAQAPTIWLLLLPLQLGLTSLAIAYWALPSDRRSTGSLSGWRWGLAAVAFALLILLIMDWPGTASNDSSKDEQWVPMWLVWIAGGMLAALTSGTVVASLFARLDVQFPERSQNRITRWLAHVLSGMLLVAGLGILDMMAWQLAKANGQYMIMVGTAVTLTVAVLRAVLPKIADLPKSLTPGARRTIILLVNAAGLAALFMVLIFWVSVVHRSVTMSLFNGQTIQFKLAWSWWGIIVVPVLVLMGISYFNRDFLNRSSLFTFYRARLVRSYLGAGNPARSAGSAQRATDKFPKDWVSGEPPVPIQDLHESDDVPMAVYSPHKGGGPVHLINACINQTTDPRGGLFNRDRKGQLLTVGPYGGVRVAQGPWQNVQAHGSMTLGSWVALSGAAVAPGLGSNTRTGIAALLTLSGIRLGYWWNSLTISRHKDQSEPRHVNKYSQLLAELSGRFEGTQRAEWFLSDGGHFENTAAYALLREECKLVVVADCGADPRYAFGDLENLVRKARIDLKANIVFLRPRVPRQNQQNAVHLGLQPSESLEHQKSRAEPHDLSPAFGSLNDLTSPDSQACLALARIEYQDSVGYMVVVKPNVVAGAPVDLVNFKADNPLFPQEPTTDQFFSEAQWESYFLLGQTLARDLKPELLGDLPTLARTCFEEDDGSLVVRDESGGIHAAAAPKRLPSRIIATGAVTASVSLGALATFGTAAWQAFDQQIQERAKSRAIDKEVLKDLTEVFAKHSPNLADRVAPISGQFDSDHLIKVTAQAGELATVLLRVGESCTIRNAEAFHRSELFQTMLGTAIAGCRMSEYLPPVLSHPSCRLLRKDVPAFDCLVPPTKDDCEPRYGLRKFETDGSKDKASCAMTRASGTDVFSQWFAPKERLAEAPIQPPPVPPINSTKPVSGTGAVGSDAVGESKDSDRGTRQAAAMNATREERACHRKTVYVQIFGPDMRDTVREFREPWRAFGANVPPIEDVLDTARRRDRSPPNVPKNPVVIYHDAASKDCAELLQPLNVAREWEVRALPRRFTAVPGVIEVWLPPGSLPIHGRGAFSATGELQEGEFSWQPEFGRRPS